MRIDIFDLRSSWGPSRVSSWGDDMYGLVNAAFRELIVSKHGRITWERICAAVPLKTESFARMDPYPDELTSKMVSESAQIIGVTTEQLLVEFGQFWVVYTDREGYGALFEIAGDSLTDFLLSLDELHARVGRNFPKLRPPSFQLERVRPDLLRMQYTTERSGLCPFVIGLLHGLSQRFQTQLEVDHTECRSRGDERCVFTLQLGEKR